MNASALPIFVFLILLVPSILPGYALINAGFGRVRGAGFASFASLIVVSIAAVVYCVVGFSLEGYGGGVSRSLTTGNQSWNWIGREPLILGGVKFDGSYGSLAMVLQIFTVGLAALIPLGAGLDRWRLRSICLSTALFAGLTYPLFAHWVWGGGWLRAGGVFQGRGFVDPGGAGTIHVIGGLTALAIAWILGPRRGKYTPDGRPAAIPGHNIVYVLVGCALLLPGWIALNSAGSMLFAGVPLEVVPQIVVDTLLCAAASCLMSVVITGIRFLKPDASLCANGWVGGLVASSAVCCYVSPLGALLTGLIAGVLVTFSVELIEVHLRTDDPTGSISVHAVGGIWGILAAGIFPKITSRAWISSNGMLVQVIAIITLLGVMMPITYGLNWLLNLIDPQRVEERTERKGVDLNELGGVAYPEFVIQPED